MWPSNSSTCTISTWSLWSLAEPTIQRLHHLTHSLMPQTSPSKSIIGFFCLNGCSTRIHPMRIRLWRGVLMTTTMYYAKAKPSLSIYSMVVDLFYNGNCRKKTISLFSWWLFGAFWLVDAGMALSSSLVGQVGRPREKCTSSTTVCDGGFGLHTGTKILNLSKNSHFESLIFHKIHNFKVTFFTKFTVQKSHFRQNSHFKNSHF